MTELEQHWQDYVDAHDEYKRNPTDENLKIALALHVAFCSAMNGNAEAVN